MINKPGVELAEHDRFMSRKAGSTQEDIARATSCAALLRPGSASSGSVCLNGQMPFDLGK